ncbi:MAG TPA: hydantoinase/oxoprolinase family protein [Blastocatellia bacterium]|nr:hydantoinase/oxoprolinase family protein [Blastocatellia bacterium]
MRVRIGIDVGGTFTDVVVIDSESRTLVGQLKFPTSHDAREGVALGIVTALERAMQQFNLHPDDVSFIAHSTTQATNALLEGDVANVAVLGIGSGIEALLAKRATRIPPIELAPNKFLKADHRFIHEHEVDAAIDALKINGAQVIVASEAFSVDRTAHEEQVVAKAKAAGLRATSGHEVSSLYGLRVRTRTAVINAAILPKMIATAEMTDACVKSSGITAPLMIMRSDGGVMSVDEVHRRPILTMLSGPAAGIAGALMHERVSDGIFIEVGGTSADISVIRDGSPVTRPAKLNGHRMYLNTLDVRTLGVGGGSMIRVSKTEGKIMDVGPRSAHIAGLGYTCFAEVEELREAEIEFIQPTKSDADDHVILRCQNGKGYALTTTCAANLLGLVKAEHFAFGNVEAARIAFEKLGEFFHRRGAGDAEKFAEEVLEIGGRKVARTIEELVIEYQLDREHVVLVGGGGGAAALVPFTAQLMNLDHRIARNAEVISPLGVAMAMVRDTIERNIVDPSPEDILQVRREAAEAAINAGAVADSIEVQIEADKRRNLVRATAMGTTELRKRDDSHQTQGVEHCREIAARSMRVAANEVSLAAEAGNWFVFTGAQKVSSLFGLLKTQREMLRVMDRSGVIRLQRGAAHMRVCLLSQLPAEITDVVEQLTDFGDAGRALPDIFVLYGARLANFSGLADLEQVLALSEVELRLLDPATKLIVIACPK